MRVGRNPLTASRTNCRGKIVCAVITHLPNDYQSYHRHRWPIVALSLRSLVEHVKTDIHLLIYDNGSIPEFREWVQDEIKPETFIASKNVGKSVARKAIFGMFPPETIMAISDDDMFYYPNWLVPQIDLMFHFDKLQPKVGTVTGYPVRTMYRWANESAKKFGTIHGKLETGHYVKANWDADYCASIGRDYEHHKKTSGNVVETKIYYDGWGALTLGHHCQFVCINGRINPLLKWDIEAMADEKPFDKAVDAQYMRLCTTQRLTKHMGNVLDDDLIELASRYNLSVTVGNEDYVEA